MNHPVATRARTTSIVIGLIVGLALLGACTSGDDPVTAPSSTAPEASDDAGYTVAFESPTADDFNKMLEVSDDLLASQQAEILDVDSPAGAPRGEITGLLISFEMASHHCYGVQTLVEESPTEIIIEVRTGLRPGIDPAACEDGVFPYSVPVDLASPLGERTVVPAEQREPSEVSDSPDPDDPTATPASTVPDSTTPSSGGEDPSVSTSEPTQPVRPSEQDVPEPFGGASHLIGRFVEDGVEWALENGIEWRVLSFDGEPSDNEGPTDPNRISFVVERDHIVSYEWS